MRGMARVMVIVEVSDDRETWVETDRFEADDSVRFGVNPFPHRYARTRTAPLPPPAVSTPRPGLEPTSEQLEALQDACVFAIGKVSVMAKAGFDRNSAAAALPCVLDVAWPLIRDMVLSEVERRLDAVESTEEVAFLGHAVIRVCDVDKAMEAVRSMKGEK